MTTDTPVPDSEDDEFHPLTLATLRALLEKFSDLPGDTPVILQRDSEANGYSPLAGGGVGMYEALTGHSGDAYPTSEEIARSDDYDEEDGAPENAVRVFILRPLG
ncbi:hypothetical protein ACH4RG_22855 [Streptomyces sp. NPDC021019]|uniref:hypothetical protein n=1 Tax=Streptomyces sp. NPDC021019 TaxID=3365108 RepID=UPI003796547D